MTTSYIAATDELFGIVKSVFDDPKWATLFGYTIDVRWFAVADGSKPDMKKLWARVSKTTVTDQQASLANANGERLFATVGLLYVQLFCPRNLGGLIDNTRELALAFQTAFRKQSPSNELWFRNQAIRELPETDENYPIVFVTEFEYKTRQPVNIEGDDMLTQRSVTGVVDGVNKTFIIGGSPASLLWFVDGLGQTRGTHYSYTNGIVTTVAAPTMGATLLAIGED